MTMYQRMGRVLAGIVFVVGTIAVTGCAENTAGTKQDSQSAKACAKYPSDGAQACCKKSDGKKCPSDCQKPCCKKGDGKTCDADCQKPCCKKT